MCNITININGGNNQIIPNATEAKQYFYGIQHAEEVPPIPSFMAHSWKFMSHSYTFMPIPKREAQNHS